jgi:murein DD-endopeptidase MepM/ murein hydrolase activator NlpD
MSKYLFLLVFWLTSCTGIQQRYHEVREGDTLDRIATQYSIPKDALEKENRVVLRQGLKRGVKLYLPFEANPDFGTATDGDRVPAALASVKSVKAEFRWPTQGRLTSGFGKRLRKKRTTMHEGIDIAAPIGTPVVAARSGHVIYAGNRISGYGNLVIVRHADSFSTIYAHLTKIHVKKGQYVSRGAMLGTVGRTGRARGAHLHFEIRDGQTPVDPALFLPGQLADNTVTR